MASLKHVYVATNVQSELNILYALFVFYPTSFDTVHHAVGIRAYELHNRNILFTPTVIGVKEAIEGTTPQTE